MTKHTKPKQNAHHVVIIGAGAAGLALASQLGRTTKRNNSVKITLVDQQLTHIWKPLLHEVAAGSFDSNVNQISLLAQAKRCGFYFTLGSLARIDRSQKVIVLDPISVDDSEQNIEMRQIRYDTLVVAVGSNSNDFGVPGVADHCLFLDNTEQANNFNKRLVETYTRLFYANQSQSEKKLSITIIGAGATGVELAAQLRKVSELLDSYEETTGQQIQIEINIVEGAERILPALPDYLSDATAKQLERIDIHIFTGEQGREIREDVVLTASGKRIATDIPVWAAGIKAPDVLQHSDDLEINRINQLIVRATLQTSRDDDIFAIGDCAACTWEGDKLVPPRAQAANQQATMMTKSLMRKLSGESLPIFKYRDYGSLVSLGEYTTVGNLMGKGIKNVRIEGLLARMVYVSLYKMHQVALLGYTRTALLTLSNLFRRSVHPEIKLH